MKKDEFLRKVAAAGGHTILDVKRVLASVALVSAQELAKADEIRVPGLVTFRAKHYPQRAAHNPKTGIPVVVPARTKIYAKPVTALANALPQATV